MAQSTSERHSNITLKVALVAVVTVFGRVNIFNIFKQS